MRREQIDDMAFELLNISFNTDEWEESFLNEAIKEVADQIEAMAKRCVNEMVMFGTTYNLFDLLSEAYDRGCFECDW